MYSLQLRRGIGRGRIWQTSALYQGSQQVVHEDGCRQLQLQQQQTRGFGGSRGLLEEKKDDDEKTAAATPGATGGEAPKPRVIPKMNFAELMKKATSLRQSVFKKPPEASATFNPPDFTTTEPPRIRRTNVDIPTDLISSAAQSSEQIGADRRAARLARHKARLLQESSQQDRRRRLEENQQQPLTISDREAQAQDRAFAQAGAFVKGYNQPPSSPGGGFKIKRVGSTAHGQPAGAMTFQERLRMARIARGVSPDLAGDRMPQQQHQAFESDEGGEETRQIVGGPRITNLPVRSAVPLGPRSARAQGSRGGGGGGRGGRGGRGPRVQRTKAAKASLREALRLEEEELEAAWNEMTSNPKPAPKGTIEPHPVYDSTKPYHADVGDLSRWIPAMGAGNSAGARKLQWVGKPKAEKMAEYAPKALLGDGILVPGEVFRATGLGEGKVTREVERALSIAEAGVLKNPTFGGGIG
ncbi:uncharacterized protein DFL_007181 [Arthrobotrys flagrans]|uniref:Uncharacterized protein n=1 Tax=Arthrobotrys flagrans TaxID=97331 RepID=A0A436ZUW8_ARTFL|nr:hypothetical protein DFL_007181 [Arthrobotrys flagrans]